METNILQLDPKQELRFRGSFKEPTQATIKLSNPSDKRVCFKVKTTAPKKYCVRPTCGDLKPRSDLTIQVLLQPFQYDPNDQQKHKFLVQSTVVPSDKEDINYETIWKTIDPARIMETKLKCILEPSGGNVSPPQTDFETPKRQYETARDVQRDETLNEELRRLKEENVHLKKENVSLRHDGLRQRHVPMAEVKRPRSRSGPTEYANSSPDPFADSSLTSVIVMSLILLAIGFLIAKTVF